MQETGSMRSPPRNSQSGAGAGAATQPAGALRLPRSRSLAEQAAEAIVHGIAAGVLQPGQRLIETDLAAMLQMSRVPLREAMKILEAQGIVTSAPHRGAYVQMFDDARIDQICEARIALEKIAFQTAAAAYAREPQRLERLDAVLREMEAAAARQSWLDVNRIDLAFHREVCLAAENGIILTLWDNLAGHVFIVFGLEVRSEEKDAIMDGHHQTLRDLLARGDADRLGPEVERHILRFRRS